MAPSGIEVQKMLMPLRSMAMSTNRPETMMAPVKHQVARPGPPSMSRGDHHEFGEEAGERRQAGEDEGGDGEAPGHQHRRNRIGAADLLVVDQLLVLVAIELERDGEDVASAGRIWSIVLEQKQRARGEGRDDDVIERAGGDAGGVVGDGEQQRAGRDEDEIARQPVERLARQGADAAIGDGGQPEQQKGVLPEGELGG